MKKTRDYHARLVIHGLDTLDKKNIKRLIVWLADLSNAMNQKNVRNLYSKRFVANLMK